MFKGHYVIDAHCHIYPDKIAHKAAETISMFYNGLHHVGGDVGTLLVLMEQQGIDYAVVNSAAMSPHQVKSVNCFLLESSQSHPDKFAHLGSVHPDCTEQEKDETFYFLKDNGFHGLKLHPDMLGIPIDDPRMLDLLARCQEAALPVLLHTGDIRYDFSNPNRLAPVLRRFPGLTVIGGHFAGRDMYVQAADRLHSFPNLCADCSSAFDSMDAQEARYCIRTFGTHRLMFGTDYPMMTPGEDLEFLDSYDLGPQAMEDILWKNAVKIYHLTPPWLGEKGENP